MADRIQIEDNSTERVALDLLKYIGGNINDPEEFERLLKAYRSCLQAVGSRLNKHFDDK